MRGMNGCTTSAGAASLIWFLRETWMKARLALQPVTRPGAGPVPVTPFLHFHLFSGVLLVFHTCMKPQPPTPRGKNTAPLTQQGFQQKTVMWVNRDWPAVRKKMVWNLEWQMRGSDCFTSSTRADGFTVKVCVCASHYYSIHLLKDRVRRWKLCMCTCLDVFIRTRNWHSTIIVRTHTLILTSLKVFLMLKMWF